MIIEWQLPVAIVGGATAGLGVFLALREAMPATPALGPALRRRQPAATSGGPLGRDRPIDAVLVRKLRVPHRDLALLGRSREHYLTSLLTSAGIGLVLPPVASVGLYQAGLPLPLPIPVAAGLVLAAVFAALAHRDVIGKAERARREFTRAVCIYLDLVALQLSAAHGPVQALEQAARVCEGWVFARIREGLLRAQLQLRLPWQELRDMAERLGVPELGDVGAIMQASGTEGAQVGETLRQQADSLRDQIRTDALARAEAITGRLDIPGAVLVFVIAIFLIFPFMARL